MEPDKALEEVIFTLESWTLDPAVRSSVELMGDLLADDLWKFALPVGFIRERRYSSYQAPRYVA
jgi:hypothetical protein